MRQIVINVPADAEVDEEALERNVHAQIEATERIRVLMEIRDLPLIELKELKARVQLEKLEKSKAPTEKRVVVEPLQVEEPMAKEVVAEAPVAEEKVAKPVSEEIAPEVLIDEEKIGESEVEIVLE